MDRTKVSVVLTWIGRGLRIGANLVDAAFGVMTEIDAGKRDVEQLRSLNVTPRELPRSTRHRGEE